MSRKAAPIVEAVLRRSEASSKAAETRKRIYSFQETLPLPKDPVADRYHPGKTPPLTPKQILPKAPPSQTREGQKIITARGVVEGVIPYNTERYIGEKQWITIAQPVVEVPVQTLIDNILHTWQANRRQWCFVNFLFFRQIPFNPLYQGELQNKAGKFVEIWFTSKTRGTESSIADSIESVFEGYKKRGRKRYDENGKPIRGADGKIIVDNEVVDLKGIYEMAETRFIWLEAIIVHTFSNKDDL